MVREDNSEPQGGRCKREKDAMCSFEKERDEAKFSVNEMKILLNGGEERTYYRELAQTIVERDPELNVKNFFDYSRPEDRAKTMIQIRRFSELKQEFANKGEPLLEESLMAILESYDRSLSMRLYVHEMLFRETIWAQGSATQFEKWKRSIDEMKVIGCYSMTEMGHSSHLPGLETTATFDEKRDEFIVHSPTLTSTKWWIGMAGQTATHTLVLAQLIIKGKSVGLHWFIVPLRNGETGRLLPGVTCGDVGAKVGRQGLDNGWLQFSHVRIPRENMLNRFGQVDAVGNYTPPASQALVYATLIGERLFVVPGVFDMTSQMITVAVRYGLARRQGPKDNQLLDFQAHQTSLMPIIAMCYALNFMGKSLRAEWSETLNLSQKKETVGEFIELSVEMHSITAGLKAWIGWWATEALETIRRSLGGHAYSAYNAIGGQIADFGVMTAGGGDNTVLAQQTARYLVSGMKKVQQRKSLAKSLKYLNKLSEEHQKDFDISNAEARTSALELLSLLCLKRAGEKLMESMMKGLKMEEAWNENMFLLLDASKAHTFYLLISYFSQTVKNIQRNDLKETIVLLSELLSFWVLERLSNLFLEHQVLKADQITLIRERVIELCRETRSQALPLVDAFGWPDWILKSPLGRYDGAIYSNYFNIVKSAPNALGVPSYWAESIAPLTKSKL
eukprot:TRINITY_DN5781_c0_g1_i1.p1 TRINITY_DN5781_c0_g1~~TRINITY_DN5781_c0_g1_i1.p1  ORF type:complete len:689 (-),score=239.46 TRINITY_DN5781_c0_g1_i1:30-2057(-)